MGAMRGCMNSAWQFGQEDYTLHAITDNLYPAEGARANGPTI
ncbi:MAG: hypothetical protein OJF49_000581 [Ktedonobacterales bacterium]|nr:MAG: hypothetical protein OJF49_000581 [Ktedonobacterales bacterium]